MADPNSERLGKSIRKHIRIEIELDLQSIPFESQVRLPVFYKERELPVSYIPDLIVHGQIIVELKAASKLLPEHEAQLVNYMRINRKPLGYLIKLAPLGSVEWKRFILRDFLPENL